MHRIPDIVGRMGKDGRFSVKLLSGSYYMGALVITDPGRGPGPPKEGETFYFAKDDKGELRTFTLGTKEVKDVGQVVGALPDTFPVVRNLVTIERLPSNNFSLEAMVKAATIHQVDSESISGTLGTSGQRYLFGANQSGTDGGAGVSVGTNGISV